MFTSLMVPLDGSPAAEGALPLATTVAARAHASLGVVAVHRSYVFDNPHAQNAWTLSSDPDREAKGVQREEAYLTEAAARATDGTSVAASTKVLPGSAVDPFVIASTILTAAEEAHVDLIAMTTRARGLVSRVGLGSVADELVRRSHVPVLLVPPADAAATLTHLLVPLDGSAPSEQILAPALDLARLLGARVTLMRVVSPKADTEAESFAYLEGVAAASRDDDLSIETYVVVARNPGDAILEAATLLEVDAIALATRGVGGLKRLVLGSVADKLVQAATLPILVRCPAPTA